MKIDPQTALQRTRTLMLDMDGTVLDLAFDNYIWKDLMPRRYAAANGMTLAAAREHLFEQYRSVQGGLDWYCLDHWAERLGIDVVQMHHDVNHRIGYLPGALEFLRTVHKSRYPRPAGDQFASRDPAAEGRRDRSGRLF